MRIVIAGHYGYNNIGDDAILRGSLEGLKRISPNSRVYILSFNPGTTNLSFKHKSARLSLPKFWEKDWVNMLKVIMDSEIVLVGGGQLLTDWNVFTIPLYLHICLLAKALGKKVVMFGQSISSINGRLHQLLISMALRQLDLLIVRDKVSFGHLAKYGLHLIQTRLAADPALIIEPPKIMCSEAFANSFKKNKNIIAVSLRKWNNLDLEKLVSFFDRVAKKCNANLIFIPFRIEEDLNICNSVASSLETESFVFTEKLSVSRVLSIIKNCDFMIGMRLHSLILASIVAVPMLGISYDPKVSGFLTLLGEGEAIYPEDFAKMETAVQICCREFYNRHKTQSRIKEKFGLLQKSSILNFEFSIRCKQRRRFLWSLLSLATVTLSIFMFKILSILHFIDEDRIKLT